MLYIFTPQSSARLEYTINLIFNELMGVNATVSTSIQDLPSDKIILGYGANGHFNIPNEGLLFEKNIEQRTILSKHIENTTVLFSKEGNFDLPFDLFSAVFYMVSRYEEYLPFTPDAHGRFTAEQSIAFKLGFLERPIVHEWIEIFKKQLSKKCPNLKFSKNRFQFSPTYDIDLAWSYKHKGFVRTIGAFAKDLLKMNFKQMKNRAQTILGQVKDPFGVYDKMDKRHKEAGVNPVIFWLLADYGKFDKNISVQNTDFQKLIQQVSENYNAGLHPSYRTADNIYVLKTEIDRFEKITNRKLIRTRQHFLRFQLPTTYRMLSELGIKEEYSMGYADKIGFRNGLAVESFWYDLEMDKPTEMQVFPFCIMDVTLQQYMKLTPQEAILKIENLVSLSEQLNLPFRTLWHNSSLHNQDEWRGWVEVWEACVKKLA